MSIFYSILYYALRHNKAILDGKITYFLRNHPPFQQ